MAQKEGLGLGWKATGRSRELRPHRLPQGLPPTPVPRAASPRALKWLSPHGWESGLGRTLLTHGPGAGARLFGPLAFLAFQGSEGGREAGQGVGVTPSPSAEEHPSLLFSEIFVPPTAPKF